MMPASEQLLDEARFPVAEGIRKVAAGRRVIVGRTAHDHFFNVILRVSGPEERRRAHGVLAGLAAQV